MTIDARDLITIDRLERVNQQSIKAFVDISIGAISIKGVRVLASKKAEGTFFVALPKEKKGETYVPVVDITSKKLMNTVTAVVLEAYKKAGITAEDTLAVLGGCDADAIRVPPTKRTLSPGRKTFRPKHGKGSLMGEYSPVPDNEPGLLFV